MGSIYLYRVIVSLARIEGAVQLVPVLIWGAAIYVHACRGALIIRNGAGGDLVEIFGDVQAIGVHPHIADAQ